MGWKMTEHPAREPGALLWAGGALHDMAAGHRFDDDTWNIPRHPGFDTVVVAPNGDLVALVDSDGTKALLFGVGDDGQLGLVRELDRSYYYADRYRYPLALFTLPDGRTGLAHCPQRYDRIEIEVAATGEKLTGEPSGRLPDEFYSRLQVSGDGKYLLSAGWAWAPVGVVTVFSIERMLADPDFHDNPDPISASLMRPGDDEWMGACWLGDDIVVAASAEGEGVEHIPTLSRWSRASGAFSWSQPVSGLSAEPVAFHGDVLVPDNFVKLYDGATGELVEQWPDLAVSPTSFLMDNGPRSASAMVAVDPSRPRFAVALADKVVVVERT